LIETNALTTKPGHHLLSATTL